MKGLSIVAFASIFIMFGPADLEAQERPPFNHGQWWTDQPYAVRYAYVAGFNDGVLDGISFAWRISGRLRAPESERLQLTEGQRGMLQEMHDAYSAQRVPADVGMDAIIDNVSYLYGDPANALVPPHTMIRVAIMRIRGASNEAVGRELMIARELAAIPRR